MAIGTCGTTPWPAIAGGVLVSALLGPVMASDTRDTRDTDNTRDARDAITLSRTRVDFSYLYRNPVASIADDQTCCVLCPGLDRSEWGTSPQSVGRNSTQFSNQR
jgi:hypothetical protein